MGRIVLCLLFAAALGAQEWVLITRANSPLVSLSAGQIRDIYLGKVHYIGDIRIFPLQLGADDPLRRQFEKDIVHLSRSALREWWIRRHYLGQRPPKVMGSAEAVTAYVQQIDGALGYVPYQMAVDANVTILHYEQGEAR